MRGARDEGEEGTRGGAERRKLGSCEAPSAPTGAPYWGHLGPGAPAASREGVPVLLRNLVYGIKYQVPGPVRTSRRTNFRVQHTVPPRAEPLGRASYEVRIGQCLITALLASFARAAEGVEGTGRGGEAASGPRYGG